MSHWIPVAPDALARAAGFSRIAGVDEAGRGPWAGPVVAAAVIPPSTPLSVRIDDSKRLTPLQRERAFSLLLERAEVGFGIVCAAEIDRRNIHQATLLAMQHAIADLPHPPELILVDGLHVPMVATPCWPFISGDQRSYAIACASIMAKVLRDRLMTFYHTLVPHYAFQQHKGYGTALHAARLRRFGPSVFHRRTFRPVLDPSTRTTAFPRLRSGQAGRGLCLDFARHSSRARRSRVEGPRALPVGLHASA